MIYTRLYTRQSVKISDTLTAHQFTVAKIYKYLLKAARAIQACITQTMPRDALYMNKIVPIILSGGSGTRLWPMSTPETPKQFLALTGAQTMFEATLIRASDPARFASPVIVANARHADLIEHQCAQAGVAPGAIILEPCARNTAPAIALAAIHCGTAPMLVMPSDQVITNAPAFMAAIDAALPLVDAGWMVTFGITPDTPETGYGYIKVGAALSPGVHKVDRFIEKPDRIRAEDMLASGDHAWNGGIFLFRADMFLGALAVHAPDMLHAAQAAMDAGKHLGVRILPDETAFAACPSDSIDYAVMEKAEQVAVAPVAMGWSDLGSWDALHDLGGESDETHILALETSDSLIRSDGIRIHTVGIKDLIVIASGNDILILPRGQSQDVKKIVEALKARNAG
jgi:mannose-1-phosphate guanylyltransferase